MDEQDRINEQKNEEFLQNRRLQKEKRLRRRRVTTGVLIVLIVLISLGAYLITSNQFIRGMLYHDLNQKAAVDRKSTRLNSSHKVQSRMPSSA